MSNRDPLYGDKNKSDYWDSSRNKPHPETSGTLDSMKDMGQSKLDDTSAKSDDMAGKAKGAADEGKQKAGEMTDKAKHAAEDGKQKAGEMAGKAQHRADEGMHKAGDSMDKAADMMRQKGDEQGGTMGTVAGSAADAMESASAFLKDTDTSQMMDQLEAYIRKNPTQSLLVAAGIGFVLSKAFK